MPDSTDASNSGLKQGIGSLAAFAIPALVAGLFGGGGALGALGAGMEGAGTLEANQEERQKQAGTMLEKMIQQQNLEAYRRQKIDLETQRNQEYSRNINSLIDTRGTQLQQGQARIDQAKLV
ncbi:MAG TPA: hypothetical protein VMU16_00590, partial [Candidatus Binataceae bacterium]|nr:hypothetical protein [Candidatus Binataceae bacterium]